MTNPTLERLLALARDHVMTPEEVFEQKVSFVYGQMMDCAPHITKEQVREHLRHILEEADD